MPAGSAVRHEVRAAAAAVAFLTTLPAGRLVVADGCDLARAGPAFPIVGAALGLSVGGFALVLAEVCPPLVAAGAALALGTALTGVMHLDALADTADALGGRSREQALRIMRDPSTGSFGTAAVALCLLIEAGALAELANERAVGPVLAAFALSRAIAPPLACLLPYARTAGGLAQPLVAGRRGRAVAAVVLAAAVSVAAVPESAPWQLLATAVTGALAFAGSKRWLGGVTGDTLGASIAVAQTVCLVVAVAS